MRCGGVKCWQTKWPLAAKNAAGVQMVIADMGATQMGGKRTSMAGQHVYFAYRAGEKQDGVADHWAAFIRRTQPPLMHGTL